MCAWPGKWPGPEKTSTGKGGREDWGREREREGAGAGEEGTRPTSLKGRRAARTKTPPPPRPRSVTLAQPHFAACRHGDAAGPLGVGFRACKWRVRGGCFAAARAFPTVVRRPLEVEDLGSEDCAFWRPTSDPRPPIRKYPEVRTTILAPRRNTAHHTPLPGNGHWLSLIERRTFPEPITNGALPPRAGLCVRRQDLLPSPSQGVVRLRIHARVARLPLCGVGALPGITSPDCSLGFWQPSSHSSGALKLHSPLSLQPPCWPLAPPNPPVLTATVPQVIFPSAVASPPFRFS